MTPRSSPKEEPAVTDSIQQLADSIGAAVGDLGDEQRGIYVALYGLLTEGEPVTPEMLAARTGLDVDTIGRTLAAMSGLFRDGARRVVGFGGLAIPKMDHKFQAEGGKPIYAWCALDPFLIVPVIGRAAKVESKDPVTGEAVTMTVTPAGLEDLSPAEAVVSLLVPAGPFDDSVIQTFCNHVHNFASLESGQKWASGRFDITLLPTDEAFEVGRRAWSFLREPATAD
jgi:alkylmercury lyase